MSKRMPTDLDSNEIVFIETRHCSVTTGASRWIDAASVNSGSHRLQCSLPMACATTTPSAVYSVSRHRNLSGPCSTGNPRPTLDNRMLVTPPPGVPAASRCDRWEKENYHPHHQSRENPNSGGGRHHHRKLDRSLSDSEDRINGNGRGVNSSRYKTELCRPFEENGHCKYGDKCQFAHGQKELRNVTRHPKYKTERCRTYHSSGFCPYGPRCHFIHEDHLFNQRRINRGGRSGPIIYPSTLSSSNSTTSTLLAHPHRPCNLSGLNSLGSSFESVSSSSTPGNLSPCHVEDQFPPIGTFSPSEVSESLAASVCPGHRDSDYSRGGSVFNFPASDAASSGSIMTPLNIQTQQMYNNLLDIDMAALARFSAVMNISQNQYNNQSSHPANLNVRNSQPGGVFDPEASWPLYADLKNMAPLSQSPVSLSDDSMGSNGSLEMTAPGSNLDNAEQMINSPHDVSRSMRLPIFNKFAMDS